MTNVYLCVHHSSPDVRGETTMNTDDTTGAVETEENEDETHIVRGLD
ncbi:hypothetical protein [Pseudonocardia parietis]|uniref:Uncharacterized protein n=1 Tax=Pseudonocardia parietis TaxID=570936 RepID=A0ABS4VMV9_9PSEU|nr:hypothetical protein [Pseudonocardia parietis]MBP2365271.1 hypothetical protein [Pseudonocardia parietis]